MYMPMCTHGTRSFSAIGVDAAVNLGGHSWLLTQPNLMHAFRKLMRSDLEY